MAMKSPDEEGPRPVRALLRRLIKAPAALSVVWPALLVIGGYVAWHQWGADHVADKFYGVAEGSIHINETPEYVRTDVVNSVYRDTAMEGLSLLDPQATAKIASAFSMNPWVRRVVSVRKLPGGQIDVHLQYRQPVAMVLVEKPEATDDERYYFFPVDGEGVLLPTGEFARAETMKYIHIVVPGVFANGNQRAGALFGDARVEAAARLAGVLAQYREDAGIVSIDVPGDPRINRIPQLELTTQEQLAGQVVNRKRFWGSPPGMESPGESTVQMKLETLLSFNATEHADLRVAFRGASARVGRKRQDSSAQADPRASQPRASQPRQTLPEWVPDGRRVRPIE